MRLPCGARLAALALLLSWAPPGAAQPPVHRVGVLVSQSWDEEAFRLALRELGYREGADLVIDVRSAQGQLARLPSLAAGLVEAGPHVIVALNTPGTRAAMAATRSIPIVMAEVGDPVATGFVRTLARPGGNVTGVSNLCGELAAKRLSLLKEALPGARRVAIMLNPADPITSPQARDSERAAPGLGLEARQFPVRVVAELGAVLEAIVAWRADAAFWLCGQQAVLERDAVPLALRHRLPLMSYRTEAARAGALLAYSPNRPETMRRVAGYVDRILKGARPADLPVEQPTKLELVVNRRTGRALGLAIPSSLLLRADAVID